MADDRDLTIEELERRIQEAITTLEMAKIMKQLPGGPNVYRLHLISRIRMAIRDLMGDRGEQMTVGGDDVK